MISAGRLSDLLAGNDYRAMSLTEWKEQGGGLLESNVDSRTLFLFDLNMEHDGGSTEEGIRLLAQVLALQSDRHVCGLLTHTVSEGGEIERVEEYQASQGLSPERYTLVAKERLYVDPIDFARCLKATALRPQFRVLREIAAEVIHQSYETAKQKLESVSIYDFERIVFHKSRREGIWEPDTLFRLFGIYQRQAAREAALGNQELRDTAATIRALTGVATESRFGPASNARLIQRLELYEDGEYLNAHCIPTDLGDIYETMGQGGVPKRYILVIQPCDVMVRSNGKRNANGDDGTLLEIRADPPPNSSHGVTLLFFDKDTGSHHYVWLGRASPVRLCILDLCALNPNGEARMTVDQAPESSLLPSWVRRHEALRKVARRTVDDWKDLEGRKVPGRFHSLVIPRPSHKVLFPGGVDPGSGSVAYGCRRIGRLCQARAVALLGEFNNFQARPAFDVDFGLDDPSPLDG